MKIIISNKSHTLFFFTQSENAVFLTSEEDRAERFESIEDAVFSLKTEILPYSRWLHEYSDTDLQPEDMIVSSYEHTTTWKDL